MKKILLLCLLYSGLHSQNPVQIALRNTTWISPLGAECVLKGPDTSAWIFGSRYYYDLFLGNVSPNGQLNWQRIFNLDGSNLNRDFTDAAMNVDSSVTAVGFTTKASSSLTIAFCMRLTSTGDTIWTKTFSAAQSLIPYDVAATPDSGALFCGFFETSQPSGFVVKIDKNGQLQWSRSISGFVPTAVTGSAAEIALAGYVAGYCPAMVLADVTGSVQWARSYCQQSSTLHIATDLMQESNGYLIAVTGDKGGLLMADSSGALQWNRKYDIKHGPPGPAISGTDPLSNKARIRKGPGNSLIIAYRDRGDNFDAGCTGIVTGTTGEYFKKFHSMVTCDAFAVDNDRVLLCSNSFPPGVGMKSSQWEVDIGLTVVNQTINTAVPSCAVGNTINEIPATYFTSTISLATVPLNLTVAPIHPTISVQGVHAVSGCNAVFSSMSDDEKEDVLLLPNPTTGEVWILNSTEGFRFTLYDPLGTLVKQAFFEPEQPAMLQLHDLPPGIYLYSLGYTDGRKINGKLLKE